ncbi:MAG: helix-turn-helix transcriptional regulator [Rhodobacteraceae bacterium]|nr:helix-turn-helix transcriptional regulator [Paracoccaceae bacterium]
MPSPPQAEEGAYPLSEAFERGHVFSDRCPSRQVLNHITSRWGVLVLLGLVDGTYRFAELRRKINGVSEKMLSQTLQTLEADGFVLRMSYPVVPPHVEYSLTPLGREAAEKVRDLADWLEVNLGRVLEAQQQMQGARSQR